MKKIGILLAIVLVAGITWFFTLGGAWVDSTINQYTVVPREVSDQAQQLHQHLTVVDLHADPLLWNRNLAKRNDRGQVDLPRLLEGNVALQVFGLVTKAPIGINYEQNSADSDMITALTLANRWPSRTWGSLPERALFQAEKLNTLAQSHDNFYLIRSQQELQRFLALKQKQPNITSGMLALEGIHAFNEDISQLDRLYDAGLRMVGLSHFFDNAAGGSAHGVKKGGITEFGEQVLQAIQEKHLILDLAHASPKLFNDVLDRYPHPVVVSHTGVQGTCPGPRNLSDAQLDRIQENGGLVGIGYWDGAICEATLEAFIKAVRYTADRIGVEHISLGSDFDGGTHFKIHSGELVKITDALLEGGFSKQEVAAIMGGNAIQLMLDRLPPA